MNSVVSAVAVKRVLVVVAIVGVVLGVLSYLDRASTTTVKAYFSSAEGLYEGDDVRVLGVKVGSVEAIEPTGDAVLVTLSVDSGQKIPAGADAAIVSPALVSGRFVQLSPAYTEGPEMEDGATIDVADTAVPVTFDDVKQQLIDLSSSLGPRKGERRGALATAISSIDQSLRNGNSTRLRTAIGDLRSAADALSDGRSDLFSTISNLNSFTKNLAVNDAAVRGFTTELDEVGGVLADNRRNLTGAVSDLASVLRTARTFFDANGERVVTTAKDLDQLAAALADRSNELAGVLHVAPHALIGLFNTIDDQAITGRATATNFDDVAQLVCGAILGTGGTSAQCRDALAPLLDLLGLADTDDLGGLPLPDLSGTRPDKSGPDPALPGPDLDDVPALEGLEHLLTGVLSGLGQGRAR